MKLEMVETIISKGDTLVRLDLKRGPQGLVVRAKAHPTLEELFATFSNGAHVAPTTHGRLWMPVGDGAKLPMAYDASTVPGIGNNFRSPLGQFSLLQLGAELYRPDTAYVNLSFLRLVGISKDPGIVFAVRGVWDLESVRTMGKMMNAGVKKLFDDFIKPIDVVIVTTMKEDE
jgi:hypothetical protein